MNLNAVKIREIQKCFKCEKFDYIRRFYRNRAIKVVNVSDSENEDLLTSEENQKEEL